MSEVRTDSLVPNVVPQPVGMEIGDANGNVGLLDVTEGLLSGQFMSIMCLRMQPGSIKLMQGAGASNFRRGQCGCSVVGMGGWANCLSRQTQADPEHPGTSRGSGIDGRTSD